MKISLILLFFVATTNSIIGQIEITLEKVVISHYKQDPDKANTELHGQGPIANFECSLYNKTNDTLRLPSLDSRQVLTFSFQGKEYFDQIHPLMFVRQEEIIIPPNQEFKLIFDNYLFLGTDIYNKDKWDYEEEVYDILPTLRINFIYEKMGIDIYTGTISRIVLKRKLFNKRLNYQKLISH